MSELHPLSPPESDYAIADPDGTSMDDVSLSSRRTAGSRNPPPSSGDSVSSRLSRAAGRVRAVDNSELGAPLTSSPGGEGRGGPKSFIGEDDPFHIFRNDLVQKIALVESGLEHYLNLVRTTDTAANVHEVKEAKKQLKRHVKHAESTLRDLDTTVRVVERSREKFPHIHDAELGERRRFVDESKDRMAGAKGSMLSDEVREKLMRDDRALTERRRGKRGGGEAGSLTMGNGVENGAAHKKFGSSHDLRLEEGGDIDEEDPERAETLLMMRQQDETLDDLDSAVTRVGYMAETIHEEIDTQNAMLKDLHEDLADAEEQLGVVMGKLAKLLKTKSKCQIGMIVVLSLIVLVLFFLVIYV